MLLTDLEFNIPPYKNFENHRYFQYLIVPCFILKESKYIENNICPLIMVVKNFKFLERLIFGMSIM